MQVPRIWSRESTAGNMGDLPSSPKAQGAKAKRSRQSEEKDIAGMSWPAGKTPQFYE